MNVIAADMCTNARRVRKRWLPKIKSMLPDSMEVYRAGLGGMGAVVGLGLVGLGAPAATAASVGLPFEGDFKGMEHRLFPDRKEPLRSQPLLGEGSPARPMEADEGVENGGGGGGGAGEELEEEEEGEAGLEGAWIITCHWRQGGRGTPPPDRKGKSSGRTLG